MPFVAIRYYRAPQRDGWMDIWFGTTQARIFEHLVLLLKGTAAPLEADESQRN